MSTSSGSRVVVVVQLSSGKERHFDDVRALALTTDEITISTAQRDYAPIADEDWTSFEVGKQVE